MASLMEKINIVREPSSIAYLVRIQTANPPSVVVASYALSCNRALFGKWLGLRMSLRVKVQSVISCLAVVALLTYRICLLRQPASGRVYEAREQDVL